MTSVNSAYSASSSQPIETGAAKQESAASSFSKEIKSILQKLQITTLISQMDNLKAKLTGGDSDAGKPGASDSPTGMPSSGGGLSDLIKLGKIAEQLQKLQSKGTGDDTPAGSIGDRIQAGRPREGGAVQAAEGGDLKGYEMNCMNKQAKLTSEIGALNQKSADLQAKGEELPKEDKERLLSCMKEGVTVTKEMSEVAALEGEAQPAHTVLGNRVAELTTKKAEADFTGEGGLTKAEQSELKLKGDIYHSQSAAMAEQAPAA